MYHKIVVEMWTKLPEKWPETHTAKWASDLIVDKLNELETLHNIAVIVLRVDEEPPH